MGRFPYAVRPTASLPKVLAKRDLDGNQLEDALARYQAILALARADSTARSRAP